MEPAGRDESQLITHRKTFYRGPLRKERPAQSRKTLPIDETTIANCQTNQQTKRIFLKHTLTASLGAVVLLHAAPTASAKENVLEVVPLGVEAYICGYPLVTMRFLSASVSNRQSIRPIIRDAA